MIDNSNIPQGFKHFQGVSPAEDHVGPFYYQKVDGELIMGMRAGAQHANGHGGVHGGVLLCFADYAATMLALKGVKETCVTISLNSDFLSAAQIGDWIEARGEVVKRTRSLTFLGGQLSVEGNPVLTFQSVLRRIGSSS